MARRTYNQLIRSPLATLQTFRDQFPTLAAQRDRSADAAYQGQPDYRSIQEALKHPNKDGIVPK